MSHTEDDDNHRSKAHGGRLGSLLILALAFLGLLLEISYAVGQGRPIVPLARMAIERLEFVVAALAPAIGIAAAAVGFGAWFVPRSAIRQLTRTQFLLLSAAAGTGILSIAVLILGLLGGMLRILSGAFLVAGLVGGAIRLRGVHVLSFQRTAAQAMLPRSWCDRWLSRALLLLLSVAGILLLCGALTPPLVYDVTEYHLGSFTDLFYGSPAGHFHPMPHNFYARFPFPIESLYDLGLTLEWPRDFSPKVLNALYVIGCALLATSFARHLGARAPFPQLAALLVVAHPTMLEVSLDAYIDAPVAFLVCSAVYALMICAGSGGRAPIPQLFPAAALILGSALVSKYTAAQLHLLPFVALLLWPAVKAARSSDEPAPKQKRTLLTKTSLLLLIPPLFWLGKNVYFYNNPLEPFFSFNSAAAARERFYIQAHHPQSVFSPEYWRTLPTRLGALSWMLLTPVAILPLLRKRRADLLRLAGFVVISYALWNLIAQSEPRFLLACALVLSVVVAVILSRLKTYIAPTAAAVLMIIFSAGSLLFQCVRLANGGTFSYLLAAPLSPETKWAQPSPPTAREKFYETNLGLLGRLLTDVHRKLPPNARVLMVYEARPYLLREWPVTYNTVWDDSILLLQGKAPPVKSAADVSRSLKERFGITHVLVNEEELRRLIEQYAPARQLAAAGVPADADRSLAYFATASPTDLYPPFFRSRNWPASRAAVLDFLRECRSRAISVQSYKRFPDAPPIEMYLAPLP